jgi:hypothetical protein
MVRVPTTLIQAGERRGMRGRRSVACAAGRGVARFPSRPHPNVHVTKGHIGRRPIFPMFTCPSACFPAVFHLPSRSRCRRLAADRKWQTGSMARARRT